MTTDWIIQIKENGEWVDDYNMRRPNDDMETQVVSTMQRVNMADGSVGYVTPETKYRKEPFNMFFAETSSEFRSQIEGYIANGTLVKIITHDSQTIIGKFITYNRIWLVGNENSFDIQVTFDVTA